MMRESKHPGVVVLILALAFVLVLEDTTAARDALPVPALSTVVKSALFGVCQDPPRRRRRGGRRRPPQAAPEKKPEEKKDEEEKKDPDKWLAIVGGTVHTVTDGRLDGATVLVKNGRIHEIGDDLPLPSDTEVVQAEGLHVYPGLVAINSSGLVSSSNNTDPYSWNMLLALAGGVTTARSGSEVVKLTYGTLDGHRLRRAPFTSITYSNVKAKRDLDNAFERIREYKREMERHAEEKKTNKDAKEPDRRWIRGLFATAESLMDGKQVAIARASTARSIRELCALATRYGFELVIERAEEGWIATREMAQANVSAIITPRSRRDPNTQRNAPNGSSIENARILHDHGIRFAIFPVGSLFAPGGGVSTSGLAGRDMLNLPLEAAFAVRGGLSDAAAIRGITIDAAKILGVDDRVGSIEVGKDGDFVITDGDLLYYLTQPRYTIVNGRICYDKVKEGILSHIRPDGGETTAPKDPWPRRLGDDF